MASAAFECFVGYGCETIGRVGEDLVSLEQLTARVGDLYTCLEETSTMPIYVAMLRGINVGGHKKIKMDRLRESFEGLGFKQVKTYIQSGNVIFDAGKTSSSALSKKIEGRIVSDFGFSASVMVRTREELGKAIDANPFMKQRGVDLEKLHVTFLADIPPASGLKKLAEFTIAPDQSRCRGREIFLYLPNGFSASSLFRVPWEKALGVLTTTRNWKTVNAIYQMCVDSG